MALSSYLGATKQIKNPWVVCIVASLFFFFEFVQLSSFDTLNHIVQDYYHLSSAQLGVIGSAFLWGNVVFLIPAGIILDKFGPRKAILNSLFVSIIGLFLFAFSSNYLLAIVGRFLSGIGNAFAFISMVVLVSQWFKANQQAFAMGMLVNMAFLGGMFAHTPFVLLLNVMGWNALMIANLAMGIFILFLIYEVVTDSPVSENKLNLSTHENELSLKEIIKNIINIQNFGAGFYTSCLNLPILVLCALWGTQYLQVVHHLTMFQSSNVVSMIFFGSMLGSPFAGWLSDRMQRRKPLMYVGGLISLGLCLPLSFWNVSLSFPLLMSVFFALGFFTSTQVLSYPVLSESNAVAYAGRACSFASMIIMGGGMIAQILFGRLLTMESVLGQNPDVHAYRFAMNMFPIAIMAALFILLMMKETFCKKYTEN